MTHLAIAAAADHLVHVDGGSAPTVTATDDEDGVMVVISADVPAGATLTVTKLLAYCTSLDHPEETLVERARAGLGLAREVGFDALVDEQRATLDRFWATSDVEIDGDGALQQGVRFNLYSLFQSAGRDGRTSLAAKGLSGEGYEGHYFWDTEIFALPFFAYTQPAIARALLRYRCGILDRARARAAEMSQAGALFPWRTIGGEEASAYFPAGTAQYHINADIAYAIGKYVAATGDRTLLADGGAEVVFETARLWADLGDYIPARDGAFCINEVTGPDEYTALVNNNGYTNLMAQAHLRFAARLSGELAAEAPEVYGQLAARIGLVPGEVEAWRRAADAMRIPRDAELGVHAQDDSFLDRGPVAVRDDARVRLPAAAALSPAGHLPPPGAQAVGHRARAGAPLERVHDRREEAQLRLLRPADHGRLVTVPAHPERRGRRARVRRRGLPLLHADGAHGPRRHQRQRLARRPRGGDGGLVGVAGLRVRRPARRRRRHCVLAPPARAVGSPARSGSSSAARRWRSRSTRHAVRYEAESGDGVDIRHFGRPVSIRAGAPVEIDLDPSLQAVIFDLDGVITDTAEHHYQAWQRLAAEASLPFDRELNERLKGVSRMESLDIILVNAGQTASVADKARLADRKNAYFRELIDQVTPDDLLPGIGELLAELRARGIRTAIASMSQNVFDVVRHLGIEGAVDAIVDPATLVKGKPDPEIFLVAAERLGIRFEDCVGIEDARAGVLAIKAARMVAVGVGHDLPDADWLVADTRSLTADALAALFPARGGQPPAIAGSSSTVSVGLTGVARSCRCRTSVSLTKTFTKRLMPPVSSRRRGPRSGYAATSAPSASPTVAPSTSISFWPPADVRRTGGMRTWLMPTASLRTRRTARG